MQDQKLNHKCVCVETQIRYFVPNWKESEHQMIQMNDSVCRTVARSVVVAIQHRTRRANAQLIQYAILTRLVCALL